MGETITQQTRAGEALECGRGELPGDEQAEPEDVPSCEDESVPEAAAQARRNPNASRCLSICQDTVEHALQMRTCPDCGGALASSARMWPRSAVRAGEFA